MPFVQQTLIFLKSVNFTVLFVIIFPIRGSLPSYFPHIEHTYSALKPKSARQHSRGGRSLKESRGEQKQPSRKL